MPVLCGPHKGVKELHDCIIIGAGPAGLTAALYLGRYRRDPLVIHDGSARAARIPLTHNVPGFPEGISGIQLLERMTDHAQAYGAKLMDGCVTAIAKEADGFRITLADGQTCHSRTVILATGILLNQVDLPHDVHEQAIEDDVLRYCAVCDAYEHIDRRIAVVGCEESGAGQALFLSRYSSQVTLVPDDPAAMEADDRKKLRTQGVVISDTPMARVAPTRTTMNVWLDGEEAALEYDVVYPCFGTKPRTELALQLGLGVDEGGCLGASSHFETEIPGFFAAGDIVRGLDQISVAMGHGAIAATNVHSWLRSLDGEL
jgi:thioredoxin reductase (NADPH)